ncbi:MAG: type I restriction enzyme HsdR N-terminal domain-containing protein [Cyclobacteriaceae bacterium]
MSSINLPRLNLPTIEPKIQWEADEAFIWDPVRKKHVHLTREEWVRQHFLQLLNDKLGFPFALMKSESGVSYNKVNKRTDIIVKNGNGENHILIECKAPEIALSEKTMRQLSVYNRSVAAQFIAITNGMQHFIWELDRHKGTYASISAFPKHTDL